MFADGDISIQKNEKTGDVTFKEERVIEKRRNSIHEAELVSPSFYKRSVESKVNGVHQGWKKSRPLNHNQPSIEEPQ